MNYLLGWPWFAKAASDFDAGGMGASYDVTNLILTCISSPPHTDLLVVVVTLKSFSPGLYTRIEWVKKTAPLWCLKNFFSYFTDTNYLSLVYNLMVINTYGFLWINCTLLLLLSLACKIPNGKRLPEIFKNWKAVTYILK